MANSDDKLAYEEQEPWRYEPGILELLDKGVDVDELPESALHGGPATTRGGFRLKAVKDWLLGFRPDALLCERAPIWVPIAEVWPVRGGEVAFSYETRRESGSSAELRVFAVAGWGGTSTRTVTKAVEWSTDRRGRALQVRGYVTVRRYSNARTGEHLDRVDIDCAGEYGDYRNVDLPESARPFADPEPDRAQIIAAGYVVTEIQRCREVAASTRIVQKSEQSRRWSFDVGLDIPELSSALKFGAICDKASAFAASFELPGGRDYAFCAPVGHVPVVPLCVSLRTDN